MGGYVINWYKFLYGLSLIADGILYLLSGFKLHKGLAIEQARKIAKERMK